MMPSVGSGPSSASPLPEWYTTYFAALLESDEAIAVIRLERAAEAIEDRLIYLHSCAPGAPSGPQEALDLSSALTYLRLLLDTVSPDYATAEC